MSEFEVGQFWKTPGGKMREILKVTPKSVSYRETGRGNNYTGHSSTFDRWVDREKAKLLIDRKTSQ